MRWDWLPVYMLNAYLLILAPRRIIAYLLILELRYIVFEKAFDYLEIDLNGGEHVQVFSIVRPDFT